MRDVVGLVWVVQKPSAGRWPEPQCPHGLNQWPRDGGEPGVIVQGKLAGLAVDKYMQAVGIGFEPHR